MQETSNLKRPDKQSPIFVSVTNIFLFLTDRSAFCVNGSGKGTNCVTERKSQYQLRKANMVATGPQCCGLWMLHVVLIGFCVYFYFWPGKAGLCPPTDLSCEYYNEYPPSACNTSTFSDKGCRSCRAFDGTGPQPLCEYYEFVESPDCVCRFAWADKEQGPMCLDKPRGCSSLARDLWERAAVFALVGSSLYMLYFVVNFCVVLEREAREKRAMMKMQPIKTVDMAI